MKKGMRVKKNEGKDSHFVSRFNIVHYARQKVCKKRERILLKIQGGGGAEKIFLFRVAIIYYIYPWFSIYLWNFEVNSYPHACLSLLIMVSSVSIECDCMWINRFPRDLNYKRKIKNISDQNVLKNQNVFKFCMFLSNSGVYIFLFDPPPPPPGGGWQKYGQISCWEKKWLKEDENRGENAYFFPNW